MVFQVVGEWFQQDCEDWLRDNLSRIASWEIPPWAFNDVRKTVGNTMAKYLAVLRTSYSWIVPDWYPVEALESPIKAVKEFVPDGESLSWEVNRFMTAIRNMVKMREAYDTKIPTLH